MIYRHAEMQVEFEGRWISPSAGFGEVIFLNCRTPPFLAVRCLVPLFSAVLLTPSPWPTVTSAPLSLLYNFHLCKPKFYKHLRIAAQTSVSFSRSPFFSPSINLTTEHPFILFKSALSLIGSSDDSWRFRKIRLRWWSFILRWTYWVFAGTTWRSKNLQRKPTVSQQSLHFPFLSFVLPFFLSILGLAMLQRNTLLRLWSFFFWGQAVMVRCVEDTQRWWMDSKGAKRKHGVPRVNKVRGSCTSPRILGCKCVEKQRLWDTR